MPPKKSPLKYRNWYLLVLSLIVILIYQNRAYIDGYTASIIDGCQSLEPPNQDRLLSAVKKWIIDGRTPTKVDNKIYWGGQFMAYSDAPACTEYMRDRVYRAQTEGSKTRVDRMYMMRDLYQIDGLYYWCFQDKMLIVTNSIEFRDNYFDEFFSC